LNRKFSLIRINRKR